MLSSIACIPIVGSGRKKRFVHSAINSVFRLKRVVHPDLFVPGILPDLLAKFEGIEAVDIEGELRQGQCDGLLLIVLTVPEIYRKAVGPSLPTLLDGYIRLHLRS